MFLVSGIVDLLELTGIDELPSGVSLTTPMCFTNASLPDDGTRAYHLDEDVRFSIKTEVAYPYRFPTDFSLLLVVKYPRGNDQIVPFAIYTDAGDEQLLIGLSTEVSLFYQDIEGNPSNGDMISFEVNIDDGK